VGRVAAILAGAIALAAAPCASARTDGGWQLSLAWPADGTLTSPFGYDPGRGRHHSGLDIGLLSSLEVRAAARGVVTRVGTPAGFDGYGVIVEVKVSDRYSNLYAHLARPLVAPGQYLVDGQPLGVAGCTGWCTGTHLHFELRDRGQPVDPTRFLSG
jgi:murein DD-endopeptidase MepM/ murein hydrolase activator NlpD